MRCWKIFSVFIFFGSIACEFEPCLTERHRICKCSETFATVLCMRQHLNLFPEFELKISQNVQKLHLEFNNITQWPKLSYWAKFPVLSLVILEFNPLCEKGADIPQRITFVMKFCSTTTMNPNTTTNKPEPALETSDKWKKACLAVIFLLCITMLLNIVQWRINKRRQTYERIDENAIYRRTTESIELDNTIF